MNRSRGSEDTKSRLVRQFPLAPKFFEKPKSSALTWNFPKLSKHFKSEGEFPILHKVTLRLIFWFHIVPMEVKARTQGSMQSPRLFIKEKRIERGARTSLENFGRYEDMDIYPLRAIWNLARG